MTSLMMKLFLLFVLFVKKFRHSCSCCAVGDVGMKNRSASGRGVSASRERGRIIERVHRGLTEGMGGGLYRVNKKNCSNLL